jgi:hypothetical protein
LAAADAGEAVDGPQHDRRGHDDGGQQQAVAGHVGAEQGDRLGGKDGRHRAVARPEAQDDQRLQRRHEPDRGDQAGQGRRPPQRPEHQHVGGEADGRRHAERDGERRREPDRVAQADAAHRQHQIPHRAQLHEHVGHVRADRAVGHVDDARHPVHQHEAQSEAGVDGAGAQPEEEEDERAVDRAHAMSSPFLARSSVYGTGERAKNRRRAQ